MRLCRISYALARAGTVGALVMGLGCVGQIPAGSGTRSTPPGTAGNDGKAGNGGQGGGNPTVDPPANACLKPTLAKPRIWRLTKSQIRNTLTDVANFAPPSVDKLPAETRLDGEFANQAGKLTIAPLVADQYFTVGDELGARVVSQSATFLKCPLTGLATGTCLADFIKGFGMKMWRRPLTTVEVGKLTALYNTTATNGGDPTTALKNVVQGMFMSPNFLYRTEVGDTAQAGAVTNLTDFELASALSYTLWDSAPDPVLLDLATQGKLRDKATLLAQATRLWGMPRSQSALYNFFSQWLQTEDLLSATKDPSFTLYNEQVAGDLLEESRLFLNSVVFQGDGSFRTLFTAPYGYVNARTAPLYGITNATGMNLVKTNLDPNQRRGFLTMAGFVSAHSDGDDTAIVSRGRYFRGDILCDHIPPPPNPALAVFGPMSSGPNMTNRERLLAHVQTPACAGCHNFFDPIGFAMENYDPIGRYRAMDKGKTIDGSGSIPLGTGQVTFKNFIDFIDQLSKTPELYACFSTQYFSFATGRNFDEINSCERKAITDDFVKSGYKVDKLVLSVVNSPSFTARQN
jgi:hypothetical protein